MSTSGGKLRFTVLPGLYQDSLVLMQLQHRLSAHTGVVEAGAAMATPANLDLLAASGLLPENLPPLQAEDLLVVVVAETGDAALSALSEVDGLLVRRQHGGSTGYRPHSLEGALSQVPEARWALVSVPGEHAMRVARQALDHDLSVFLYSDNVPLDEEVSLKRTAASRGLMILGPDCGTAIIGGGGMGFANRVRRGSIGLLGGSGTGLQAVSVAIHRLGAGISQVIGTGGRDLSVEVRGVATRQALSVLDRDSETEVLVLVSKAPAATVAAEALRWAADVSKPVVVYFQGFSSGSLGGHGVQHAESLTMAAALAVDLAGASSPAEPDILPPPVRPPVRPAADTGEPPSGFLRGLFAGGTLAAETLLAMRGLLDPIYSNLAGSGWRLLESAFTSQGHTVVDLGADELTRGRLHPMIDPEARLQRLRVEAADPEVRWILLDVVLGDGAQEDPAADLAPAIDEALARARTEGHTLEIVVLLLGTPEDPQNIVHQGERLTAAGATVVSSVEQALGALGLDQVSAPSTPEESEEEDPTAPEVPAARLRSRAQPRIEAESLPRVPSRFFERPLAAINIGLESFHESLREQGVESVHMDWRPPALGNPKLLTILDRLRSGPATIEDFGR